MSNANPWGTDEGMAVCAVRYCLGARTYVVEDCARWLVAQWASFGDRTREQIRRDVDEAFARDDADRAHGRPYHHLGWDCDRASWERVRALWQGAA